MMQGQTILLYKNQVTLELFLDEDLKAKIYPDGEGFGSITVESTTNKEDYYADNLKYFTSFDTDKDRRKEVKKDLKKLDQFYKGVLKDIDHVFRRAYELFNYKP